MTTDLQRVLMPGRILLEHVGGNTTYAQNLARGLRTRGVRVDPLAYSRGAAIKTLLLETAVALKPRTRGTVMHFVADTGTLLPAVAPCVVTVHGVASRWITTARTPSQERAWRARVRRALHVADEIVTVSESSREDICEVFHVAAERIHVIPHGINVPDPKIDLNSVRPEIREAASEPFILFVGNIEPRKNLIELVNAMAHRDLDGYKLIIAGRPAWNFDEILHVMSESDRVKYLGFITEAERLHLMRSAEAFVFPSLYEGFGFPVLEAMAVGAPVVCSSRGALAEVAGPARRLEELDAGSIAVELASALGDEEWKRNAASDGPRWAQTFSWQRSVDSHVAVYERALG